MRWLILVAVAGCNSGGLSGPGGENCTMAVCRAGGHSYKFCSSNSGCRYVGSDGSTFNCRSCGDCAAASNELAQWCGTSTTGGTTSGPTTGGTTGGPAVSCTLPQQTCGMGMKCIPTFDGSNWNGTCVAAGPAAAGQPCVQDQSDPNTLNDNCGAGFICDDLFGNSAKICRQLCATNGDCPGQRCGDFLYAFSGFGWCATPCVPFTSAAGNCPSGMDCGETVDDAQMSSSSESGFFFCKKTGSGAAFSNCGSDADCGANLWCGSIDPSGSEFVCLPNCNDSHPCLMPPADAGAGVTLMCHPLMGQPQNAGYCLSQ